ncbi:RdgB/HAM1 family non-canonical purine NTP pyrophosphatase [Spirulina sp. CCNP1310]|uniref:RdgB/HAM1 family non-canonical purine NTP pyrophosphatase n=1 Tax=Spirulina sp. CCNP1310 TaxID=3110249 RepID=UPI002B1EE157|nr:RdgB/HAM1 family non-canonical purine NTP pyrophosphatase [Spirulina sp. CCNP1310]MEA5420522.1 RdgB/HAM1 family non-canonical purine NTP pyrophosphatase [Spirulina sp. CCNP1310]
MERLVVATGNPGKIPEMAVYFEGMALELALKPPELEIEETGTTFLENAELKAAQVAIALKDWAIADDSGLTVAALGGAPGIYSARYGANDGDRIARLLQELGENPHREAAFICALAVARPDGSIARTAEGYCPGEILTAPQGTGGFGYDPIFYVPEIGLTFAEMAPAQKDAISHRGRAFAQLLTDWPPT